MAFPRAKGLIVAAALLAASPALAQLQAPRPELTTGPPSPPNTSPPKDLAPRPPAASALPSIVPSAPPAAAGPHPASLATAVRRAHAAGGPRRADGAEDLNHREMERLRRARPDIAPPAALSDAAVPAASAGQRPPATSSPADALNRSELAGARAERSGDGDPYGRATTVRP